MSAAEKDPTVRTPVGRIEFDERGNAVWKANEEIRSEDTLLRRLRTSQLSLDESPMSEPVGTAHLETGFDPYSSGNVVRDTTSRKKTDLRKLSEEIKRQRAAGKKTPP